jgi:hypothetical protein
MFLESLLILTVLLLGALVVISYFIIMNLDHKINISNINHSNALEKEYEYAFRLISDLRDDVDNLKNYTGGGYIC